MSIPGAPAVGGMGPAFQQRPWLGLLYLLFVFLPLAFDPHVSTLEVLASVLACLLFLPVYRATFRSDAPAWPAWACAALGYALMWVQPGGNTFTIYAMAILAYRESPRRAIAISVLLLAVLAIELWWQFGRMAIGYAAIVAIIGTMVIAGALYDRMQASRMAALERSHDEVRRLGALAERERIARDLHDLLGHTLSVVVLKSELAGKLIGRDTQAARTQVAEIEDVARQALREVREAVTGMRGGNLRGELAAARLVLLGAGIELADELPEAAIRAEVEAVLAFCLREAITNVIRHARARRVEIGLSLQRDLVELSVRDDGRGEVQREGNGLKGIRERLATVDGELAIEHAAPGTRLRLRVPDALARAPLASGARP